MRTIKIVSFFLLSCCFSSKIYSQFVQSKYYYYYDKPVYFEIGAGVSAMNCITDIGGSNGDNGYYFNEVRIKNYRPGGSIYGTAMYHNIIGARLEGTWGQVQSSDNDLKPTTGNPESRRLRNLSFKSTITEMALLLEFHPLLLFNIEGKKWIAEPYVTTGVGFFSFNPQTQYKGNWVDLKPLHTEGQGFPEYPNVSNYSRSQVNIPIGIGVRYNLSSRFNIRLEYEHRILFTDYLDDASSLKFINPAAFDKNLSPALAADAKALYNRTSFPRIAVRRGNPNNNDTYLSFSLKLGVVLSRVYKP
jgi:hypothetical protein